jgi:hypothetical protein
MEAHSRRGPKVYMVVKAECHAIDIMHKFFLDGKSYYSLNNGKSAYVRIRCRMLQVSSASNFECYKSIMLISVSKSKHVGTVSFGRMSMTRPNVKGNRVA